MHMPCEMCLQPRTGVCFWDVAQFYHCCTRSYPHKSARDAESAGAVDSTPPLQSENPQCQMVTHIPNLILPLSYASARYLHMIVHVLRGVSWSCSLDVDIAMRMDACMKKWYTPRVPSPRPPGVLPRIPLYRSLRSHRPRFQDDNCYLLTIM